MRTGKNEVQSLMDDDLETLSREELITESE
jgi:hypothetical protein